MQAVYKRITLRLVPFLMLLYLVAFLDRVNVSFAALTMNHDLGIGDGLFGLAAGMFFLGYFVFEVPSNLMLVRVGARRWIMILMVVWGALSVGTAFVHGPTSYLILRFLLGVAESGFFPGVILYLTFWLPSSVRSGVMALFVAGIPISNLVGAPLSAEILRVGDLGGLRSWQWLFVLEGSPAILLGLVTFFVLPDRPADVNWLSATEKSDLQIELEKSSPAGNGHAHGSVWSSLGRSPVVLGWSLSYFLLMLGLYGLGFWIPQVLRFHGMSLTETGWATAIPYLAAVAAMLLWSRHSDLKQERRWHLAVGYLAGGAGFAIAALAPNTSVAIAGFALGAVGILSAMPVFWGASTLTLAGPMVAAHIALINAIGNLGGFVGPASMGWLREATQSFAAGLCSIGVCLGLGAWLVMRLCRPGDDLVRSSIEQQPHSG